MLLEACDQGYAAYHERATDNAPDAGGVHRRVEKPEMVDGDRGQDVRCNDEAIHGSSADLVDQGKAGIDSNRAGKTEKSQGLIKWHLSCAFMTAPAAGRIPATMMKG
jgi:hypothetical protein